MRTPDTSPRVKAPEVTPPTPPEAAREAEVRAMDMAPSRISMAMSIPDPEVLTHTLGTTEATKVSTPGRCTGGPLQLEGSVKDTQVIHLFLKRENDGSEVLTQTTCF